MLLKSGSPGKTLSRSALLMRPDRHKVVWDAIKRADDKDVAAEGLLDESCEYVERLIRRQR